MRFETELDDPELEDAYAAVWDEWQASGEETAWEVTIGDGLPMVTSPE